MQKNVITFGTTVVHCVSEDAAQSCVEAMADAMIKAAGEGFRLQIGNVLMVCINDTTKYIFTLSESA